MKTLSSSDLTNKKAAFRRREATHLSSLHQCQRGRTDGGGRRWQSGVSGPSGFLPTLTGAVFCKSHEDVVLLPLEFYSFYLHREGQRQSQRFGWREQESGDKVQSSSDWYATQTEVLSYFPLAVAGSVRASLTGKLSPQERSSRWAKFLLFA